MANEIRPLTDNEILGIHDSLTGANPDLIRFASTNTRFVAGQSTELLLAQEAYEAAMQSGNAVDISATQVTLESAENAFYFSFTELFDTESAREVFDQLQNIVAGLHPATGQAMEYTEIAGQTYFVPVENFDTAPEVTVAATPAEAEVVLASAKVAEVEAVAPAEASPRDTGLVIEGEVLSTEQLDTFWNAEANFRLASLDTGDNGIGLHTYMHVVGNPEYVGYFDQYVAANGLVGPEIDALRSDVVAAHQDAAAILETIEYDGLQMAYYDSSQNFYTAIETENYAMLGENYTAPADTSIFTGLGVTQPLAPEVLTEIQAPLEPVRPDVFLDIDTPVIVVSPDDGIDIPEPSFLENLAGAFIGAAHAGTLPADMDTSPAELPAPVEAAANDAIAPTELNFGDEITTNGGITEFAASQNLTFGATTEGATGLTDLGSSFDTAQFLVRANAAAEATSTPYTVSDTDTSLTQIMHDYYGIEDPGTAYRAALIIAAANDIPNPDRINSGDPLSIPSMEVLQKAAGTDDLRLKNLTSHPAEIGAQVRETMNGDTPVATIETPDRTMALS